MQKLKKSAALLLTLLIMVGLSSCVFRFHNSSDPYQGASDQSVRADFSKFITGLPARLISPTDLNLNFLFNHPETYGIKKQVLSLPYNTKEDYEESEKDCSALLKELRVFPYERLDPAQQIDYEVLEDYLDRQMLTLRYFDLDNSYLGSFIGFQAQLPLLLSEFAINDKTDLDSYFHILETSGETFEKYAQVEAQRQKKGVGLSAPVIKKVIGQCESFAKNDNSFLVEAMDKKIDAADFLSDPEKKEAKAKNKKLTLETLVNAYKTLGKNLSNIEVKSSDLGLYYRTQGRDYYEALVKQSTGTDMSVQEIKEYLTAKKDELLKQAAALLKNNPELAKLLDSGKIKYGDFKTAEENIDYLAGQMAKDYPALDVLNYKVIKVPDSMKDNFSPAAYLQSRIDKDKGDPETIFINGDYDQSIFTTVAHEGYPGHMYQNCYFQEQNRSAFRYMVNYSGYSEGWATYVEWNVWKYSDTKDKTVLEYMSYNDRITACIIGLLDIAIHYDGMTYEDFSQQIKTFFGDLPDKSVKEQFNMIQETPGNYLKYYLNGFLYQDLYDQTESELEERFNSVEFNKALLIEGPTCYNSLKARVNQYIIENQKQPQDSSGITVFSSDKAA